MKKTKYLNKTLIGIIGTLGLCGAAVGGGILAYTNANVDQLDVLTRAVRDNTVEQYKARAPGNVEVAAGLQHSAAIINNKLYTWGNNDYGQLGLDDTAPRDIPTEVKNISNGPIPQGAVITAITLGDYYSAALINGALYTWGRNDTDQLGLGDNWSGTDRNIPTKVENISNGPIPQDAVITEIALGNGHASAVINGKIYTWGSNEYGELGLGDNGSVTNRNIPTEVKNISNGPIPQDAVITAIELGDFYSAAIINGLIYTWGFNMHGQLGLGDSGTDRNIPTEITKTSNGPIPQGAAITGIALGNGHASAVINGKIYTWGSNEYGQLGLGDNGSDTNRNIPTEVKNTSNGPIPQNAVITAIALGYDDSAAIINGQIYTWGFNSYGQLGLGDRFNNKFIPTEITKTSNGPIPQDVVTQISLGAFHSAAVIDGQIYTWGYNANGQLGNTANFDPSIPSGVESLIKNKDITLDANNDPAKLRDDIVYNIDTTELESLIDHSKATIGIDPADTYTITNRNNTATLDSIKKGQISVEVNTTQSSKNIIVNFNGFKPVKETQSIAGITKTITSAPSGEINDLVAKANADTTGTASVLARWIIDTNNRAQIIGDVTTKYTENFPLNTRITKVSDFTVVNGTTGEISFKIEVDKYYKLSGTDLIESVAGDLPITLTNKITLSGFDATRMSAISVIPTSNRDFSAKELLDSFGFVNETTAITRLTGLKNYLTDLDNFPTNTAFKIVDKTVTTDPITKKATLAFRIEVDKYFDNSGIQVVRVKRFNTDKLEIDGLKDSASSIIRNNIPAPNTINATVLLNDFGGEDKPITPKQKAELEKYLDFSNFSGITEFQIIDATKTGTTLTFKVSADRSIDASGNEVIGNKVFPANDVFTFDNLKDSTTRQPALKSKNSLLTPDAILTDMGYTLINSPSGPVTKSGLEQYFTNIDTFPPNAIYELRDLVKTPTTLTFKIYASISWDAPGNDIPDFISIAPYTITGVLNASTTVSEVPGYNTNILSGDLWKSFNVQSGGSWNEALTNPYFQIRDGAAGATYTMQKVSQSHGNLSLKITASSHKLNGVDIPTSQEYYIVITGLISAENSIAVKFEKDIISGDGASISQQIETQLIVGNTINSNNPLLQEIANTAAYPPNTTFTIDAVTPVDKVIFKTFSITLTANQFYHDQTTMIGTQQRTINIANLKFSPTKYTNKTSNLPSNIKNEDFLTYVEYDGTGAFNHTKLQEFFVLQNFDLTTPNATRMTNARTVNNEIKFELVVTHYVGLDGIGVNGANRYNLSIDLNNQVGVLPGTGTGIGSDDKPTETMILATSIAGGVFLLFLLLLLLLLLIRRKRHMAEHYMIVSQKNNESGNRTRRNNKKEKRNKGNGEYDQFWIDHQEDLRRSNRKKD